METGITKKGTKIWVDFCPDTEPNEGGFYCGVYDSSDGSDIIDDFVIQAEDISKENTPEIIAKKHIESITEY